MKFMNRNGMLIHNFIKDDNSRDNPTRVLVVGDIMVDGYIQGKVSRVSPEAPCPVFAGDESYLTYKTCPGGAANVAHQLQNFNVDLRLVGLIDDKAKVLLNQTRISCKWCPTLELASVPLKIRTMDGNHQILRSDYEDVDAIRRDPAHKRRIDAVKYAIAELKPEVVILSDYAKGMVDPELVNVLKRETKDFGIPMVVDPILTSAGCQQVQWFDPWPECPTMKMNLVQALQFHPDASTAVRIILEKYRTGAVVVTRGQLPPIMRMMGAASRTEFPTFTPKQVLSTVGAGDCFAAILGLALARKHEMEDAVTIAHACSAAYVSHKHNQPIVPEEALLLADPTMGKICTISRMEQLCSLLADKKIVYTNGVFDLLHPGHMATLRWAKEQGDVLVVGVNHDESAHKLKGKGPVYDLDTRMFSLASLSFVDYVVPFLLDTPVQHIAALRPAILVKGPDYKNTPLEKIPGHGHVKEIRIAPDTGFKLHSSDLRRETCSLQ